MFEELLRAFMALIFSRWLMFEEMLGAFMAPIFSL